MSLPGIASIKEEFKIKEAAMRYEDGGKVQVYILDGKSYRLDGRLMLHEVRLELKKALA